MKGLWIKEIAFIGYPTTDFGAARRFYGGVLGLKEIATYAEGEELQWLEYDIAGQTLALSKSSHEWLPRAHGDGVCIEVEDIDEAVAYLQAQGVKIVLSVQDYPVCRMAMFSDPDGNTLALHQRKLHHPDHA